MLCCNWIHHLVTGIQHSSRNTPLKTNHKLNYCKQEEIRRGNYCLQALLLASPNLTTTIINLVNRRCYSNYSILQDATVTISTGVIECVARCYSNQMLQVDTPRYCKQVHTPTRREFRQESVPHTLFIRACALCKTWNSITQASNQQQRGQPQHNRPRATTWQ